MYKIFSYNSSASVEYSSGVQRLSRTYPYVRISKATLPPVPLAGRVRCWGLNASGNLGYGNTTTGGDDERPYDGDVNVGKEVLDVRVGDTTEQPTTHVPTPRAEFAKG